MCVLQIQTPRKPLLNSSTTLHTKLTFHILNRSIVHSFSVYTLVLCNHYMISVEVSILTATCFNVAVFM